MENENGNKKTLNNFNNLSLNNRFNKISKISVATSNQDVIKTLAFTFFQNF